MPASPSEPPATGYQFVKALGLLDVVAMNVVAVVGLRWIARGARAGAPSITLWLLAWAAFFLPLAVVLTDLSRRYPDQGGVYAWTRRAFGSTHGFICGWCLWMNNLFYFPSLLLFGAANALLVFGDRFAGLADSRAYSVTFVLVALWFCVALNIVGLNAGKWLQYLGSFGQWLPAGLLIAFGVVAYLSFGSATSFAPTELIPRDDFWSTMSLWSAMCFAFSGFEISSYVGQEIRNPTRTVPRGVLIAGAIVTLIYIGGSTSVLVALPASSLSERSGIADAVELASARVGLAGFGVLTAALLTIGPLAGTSSWVAGAARVPFAAGVDRALPRAFASMHPRYGTPHVALIIGGMVSTLIFLSSVFLTVTGARTTVQEAYDIMVNLTILIYFVPYMYLFLAPARLIRQRHSQSDAGLRPRPPGGSPAFLAVSVCGFLATAVSLALVFIPPAGTENVLNYEINLIGQAALVLGVGLLFYWHSSQRTTDGGQRITDNS